MCMSGYTLLKDLSLSTQRQKTDGRLMFSLDPVSSGKPRPCVMKDESNRAGWIKQTKKKKKKQDVIVEVV